MKILYVVSILTLLLTSPIFSQSYDYTGGYGHFFTGPAWLKPNDLIDHLQKPEVLGPSFDWNNIGITSGAEGLAEIHQLLVGGGGFGTVIQNMTADSGTVRCGNGGGYLKGGYGLHQTNKYFLSLTAGFGGGVLYVGIENNSVSTPIYFSSQIPILPRGEADYFNAYLLYDVALANKLIATPINPDHKSFGGFMLGLDLGATIGVPVANL